LATLIENPVFQVPPLSSHINKWYEGHHSNRLTGFAVRQTVSYIREYLKVSEGI